jgi:hypothetical protein
LIRTYCRSAFGSAGARQSCRRRLILNFQAPAFSADDIEDPIDIKAIVLPHPRDAPVDHLIW